MSFCQIIIGVNMCSCRVQPTRVHVVSVLRTCLVCLCLCFIYGQLYLLKLLWF